MNWFTIQPRTLMNLMIQASKTYLNQTLSQNLKVLLFRNALFKDTEHFNDTQATSRAVRRNTGNVYELLLFMNLSILGNRDFKLQDL